jgi:RHS repeat-associated protein
MFTGCPVAAVNATLWDVPGPANVNNGVREFKLCYSNVSILTSLGQGALEYSATWQLMTGVVLPDGTTYRFDYNSYGDLAKVYLPTGGTITYHWQIVDQCRDGNGYEIVAQRALFDGSNTNTWIYNPGSSVAGGRGIRVTDPLGNDTVYNPAPMTPPPGTFASGCATGTGKIQYYNGSYVSGTLLKTVTNGYQALPDPSLCRSGNGGADPTLLTSVTTAWGSDPTTGETNQFQQSYDSGFTFSGANCAPGNYQSSFGLVTTRSYYDYGVGAPSAAPLSTTTTNYLYTSNSGYLNANILKLRSSDVVTNSSGNKCSETDYSYDVTAQIVSSGVTMQHVSAPSPGILGDLTSMTHQLSSTPCQSGASWSSLPPTLNYVYDTGRLQKSLDSLSNPTTYGYSGTYYGAYPTTVTNALNQSTTYTYDFNTGLMASLKDQNNQTTSYQYDIMLRVTNATFPSPDGGQSNFYYPNTTTVEMKKQIDATRWTDSFTYYDGLSRESRSMSVNDEASPNDQVDTCYDADGRVGFKSYAYQGNGLSTTKVCSGAGDAFVYDALNRVTQVTHSDSSTILTSYAGRATSVQDEGNGIQRVQRISQVDGLGRLASLCEVASATQLGTGGTPAACGQDITGTGFLTAYGYDGLSNLTSGSQGGYLPRSFVYDSLSRLTSAMNPESGMANFGYDNANRLITRTGPKPTQTNPSVTVTATMGYDQINRLRTKSYANSDNSTTYLAPAVTFNYDETSALGVTGLLNTTGRESSAVVAGSQAGEVFSYDQLGRTKINSQCVPQNCSANAVFPITYNYDLLGDMTSSTNGKGVTLSYTVNRALRLTGLTSSRSDSNNPGTLYSSAHYNGAGSLLSAAMGNSGSSISETRGYDARLKLNSITDGSLYTLTIPTNGYAPNGNILLANDSVNGNWTYGYDALNRLASANATGQAYTYAYDRFGNRWQQNGPHTSTVSFSGNNNRMDGYSYDAAGNLLNDGTTNYTYDSENRIVSVTNSANGTSSYQYDANGRRVRKTTVAKGAVDFLYDLGGNEIVELGPAGFWNRGEVYAGQRHVATYIATTTHFNLSDWLGTERARSTSTGTPFETCTSLPFGDWLTCTGSSDSSPMHFTGKEHDSESGLENFGARYDSSQYGRFMTPDPIFMTKHRVVDPQQWNLYAYVRNNPLNLTDPTGRDLWATGCGKESDKCHKNYVGTWDKDHENFTPTTIQSDKNGNFQGHNVTMNTSGITIDGKYQGVFASGTAATVVNGTGNLSGFQATFNSNCLGHCEAEGNISALPGHSFSQLLPQLRGPNEKADVFSGHEGDQYRGGNTEGPDAHISYLANRDSQSFHFDWRFPFGSGDGLLQHSKDFVETGFDKLLGRQDPPYDQVGP